MRNKNIEQSNFTPFAYARLFLFFAYFQTMNGECDWIITTKLQQNQQLLLLLLQIVLVRIRWALDFKFFGFWVNFDNDFEEKTIVLHSNIEFFIKNCISMIFLTSFCFEMVFTIVQCSWGKENQTKIIIYHTAELK